MADHELSVDKAIFEAHFAVKMGELIVTGNFGGICSVIKLLTRISIDSIPKSECK